MNSKINGLALFFLVSICSFAPKVEAKFLKGLYHTVEETYNLLDDWVQRCSYHLKRESIESNGKEMDYYSLEETKGSNAPVTLFIFGEHSRESITTELAIFFIKSICSPDSKYDKETKKAIMAQNKFILIPIVNVPGKILVEKGNYCKRTNENGVDLNRNWDSHWKGSNKEDETYPGRKAFSEWQTNFIKNIMEKHKPRTFMSLHSGVIGLYIPFAYKKVNINLTKDREIDKLRDMIVILNNVNKKYCHCNTGPAANELWYLCPGTCLDYAFEEINIPYTFAAEIFDGISKDDAYSKIIEQDKIEPFRYSEFRSQFNKFGIFLQKREGFNKKLYIRNEYGWDMKKASCFSQTSMTLISEEPTDEENEQCAKQFNPLTEKLYNNTLVLWTNIIFEIVSNVAFNEKNNK